MQLCPAYTDRFSDLGNPTFLLEAYGVRNIPLYLKKKENHQAQSHAKKALMSRRKEYISQA